MVSCALGLTRMHACVYHLFSLTHPKPSNQKYHNLHFLPEPVVLVVLGRGGLELELQGHVDVAVPLLEDLWWWWLGVWGVLFFWGEGGGVIVGCCCGGGGYCWLLLLLWWWWWLWL